MISLKIVQLKKVFGAKTVFADVSFEYAGGPLGIAGPNGSGKSTFLKCLGFLLRPTNGSLEWNEHGKKLAKEHVKKRLGYAAPYINLYEGLSCLENLEFLAKVRHETYYGSQIEEWLKKVGLNHVANQPFGKLSTGQQQRLRLASALFHQPDILLLDEPGSNLDDAGKEMIAGIAEGFRPEDKLLVLASNNSGELNLCERVFSIEEGAFV